MGYSWQGCAGVDHKRPYYEFRGGPHPCPQNRSLQCSGYVDGARWMPPKQWDPEGAMSLDFGGDQRPVDRVCREVSDGVFERRYQNLTVRLDCNTFSASFTPADNAPSLPPPPQGGYGGLGFKVPDSDTSERAPPRLKLDEFIRAEIDSAEHRALNLDATRQSMVLLQNPSHLSDAGAGAGAGASAGAGVRVGVAGSGAGARALNCSAVLPNMVGVCLAGHIVGFSKVCPSAYTCCSEAQKLGATSFTYNPLANHTPLDPSCRFFGKLEPMREWDWNCTACISFAANISAGGEMAKAFVDKRDIMQAVVMLNDGYTDQPYCAVNNGARPPEWSCVVTGHLAHGETGHGR
jgi:hypothetical protein